MTVYDYQLERSHIFTDAGQRTFLIIRDRVHSMLARSGAVRMHEAIVGVSSSTMLSLACVDRLVDLGELVEVSSSQNTPYWAHHYRVFMDPAPYSAEITG